MNDVLGVEEVDGGKDGVEDGSSGCFAEAPFLLLNLLQEFSPVVILGDNVCVKLGDNGEVMKPK